LHYKLRLSYSFSTIILMSKEGLNLTNESTFACRDKDVDPDLFFPLNEYSKLGLKQIEMAKAICKPCPAQNACLIFALKNPEIQGVWGGTTEGERAALRKRYSRSKA
jgi:WhiB family redox-sensing transcriptional regulator